MQDELRHGRHVVFRLHVHLVFVAKYRRRVFDGDAINRLRMIFAKVCADFEAQLIEMDGEDDHVHLLVECDPQYGIHSLIKLIKGRSSRLIRQEFPKVKSRIPTLWTNSYFVCTVGGAPLAIIMQYIENQKNV